MLDKIVKIAFLVPPFADKGVIRDYAGGLGFESTMDYLLPPLGLLQLAAGVRPDMPFVFIDAQAEKISVEDLVKKIMTLDVDVVVMELSIPTLESDMQCAKVLAEARIKVVAKIATHDSGILYRILLDKNIAYCLVGECDDNISDILSGNDLRGTARLENGEIKIFEKSYVANLNGLPNVDWSLVRHEAYVYPKLGECVTMLSSRGCPFPCKYYCPYPLTQGERWRFRSAKSVVQEMQAIKALGIKRILFRDPLFTLSNDRVKAICLEIIENDLGIEWWCETRVDCLTVDLLKIMRRAGCQGINIGVESGDVNLRFSLLKTGVTDEAIYEVTSLGNELGIKICFLLMVGFPGETRLGVLSTGRLLQKCRPFSMGVSFPVNYPGTKFDEDARKNDWLMKTDASNLDGSVPVILGREMSLMTMIEAKDFLVRLFGAISKGDCNEEEVIIQKMSEWASQ